MNNTQFTKLAAAIGVATMMSACGGGSSSSGGGGTTVAEGGNGFVVFPAIESTSAIAVRSATPRAALPAEYLYKTDGTPAGTSKIVDDNNNGFEVGSYRSGYMAELDGTFYYAGKDSNGDVELWATDGTGGGTERVADIYANGSAQPYNMVPAAGKLFMNAVVEDASGVGRDLVVFDPASDTHQVLTTMVGNDGPESLTAVDGGLFFFDESASNNDVYFTDGTVAGTVKVATEAGAAPAGSPLSTYPHDIYDSAWLGYNGKLLFTGYKDASDYTTRLYELDQDGNIKEITFDDGGSTVQLEITENVVISNGKVYFVADKGTSTTDLNIFEYDGSTVTNLTASEANKPYDEDLVGTSLGVFMYVEQAGVTPYLLRVDNTGGSAGVGAALRSTGDYSFSDVQAWAMVEANGTVFFAADTEGAGGSDFGTELWKTDGTSQGTELVKDIDDTAAGAGSEPYPLTFMYQVPPTVNGDLGSKYLFVADDGSSGLEPWVSDGSAAGTVILKDISAGSGDSVID